MPRWCFLRDQGLRSRLWSGQTGSWECSVLNPKSPLWSKRQNWWSCKLECHQLQSSRRHMRLPPRSLQHSLQQRSGTTVYRSGLPWSPRTSFGCTCPRSTSGCLSLRNLISSRRSGVRSRRHWCTRCSRRERPRHNYLGNNFGFDKV